MENGNRILITLVIALATTVANGSLFVLPFLVVYFAWKRRLSVAACAALAATFVVAVVFANVYPFASKSSTQALTALHLPIALWLAVGIAYAGGRWFAGSGRMNFVRFSGELFIYYVLIALGGGVLTAFTMMMFYSIGMNAQWFAQGWLETGRGVNFELRTILSSSFNIVTNRLTLKLNAPR